MKRMFTMAAVFSVAATMALAEGDAKPPAAGGEGHGMGRPNMNPEEFFKKIDANGNGVIDKAEFKGAPERFAAIDADGSGTLTKEELKAAHEKHMKEMGNPEARYKAMDKNGNGVIEKSEFPGASERFDAADTDKSGTLTMDEMKAARAKRMSQGGGEGGKHGDQAPAPEAPPANP